MATRLAAFIEPMLLLRTEQLPEGPEWQYELKLDGYRALAIKSGGRVELCSRNGNDFSQRYAPIAQALASMPDETVLDGEVVALDSAGKPSFNTLQNYRGTGGPLLYYVFDILVFRGKSVMEEPLTKRQRTAGEACAAKGVGTDSLFAGAAGRTVGID